jgi:hypothetical protein
MVDHENDSGEKLLQLNWARRMVLVVVNVVTG